MTRWYSMYSCVLIFSTMIWSNYTPPTFALRIETDKQKLERALHAFMAKKDAVSMENISSIGKRIIRKFSICGLKKPQKLNLCKRSLVQEDEFENEFKTEECETQTFQYVFYSDKDPEISMYQCPNLRRRHQKTGEMVVDTRLLYISRMSTDTKQAMVYKREYEGGMLVPTRHLLDITKTDLNTEPSLPREIRSRDRFPPTPDLSPGNSRAVSPTRDSPLFITAPSTPTHQSQPEISSEMSPVRFSAAGQPATRKSRRGTPFSAFLSPMARVPQNVGTETSYSRKKSAMSTPTGSPLHSRNSPASGLGQSTPYFSPSLSPVSSSAGVEAGKRSSRRAPPGIFKRSPVDQNKLNSASTSGESTEDSSGATDFVRQGVLGSRRLAGAARIGGDARTNSSREATNISKRRGNVGTSNLSTTRTTTKAKAHGKEAVKSSIPPGHPKQMYKHRSFNKDRTTHSEGNTPPNEWTGFPVFQTPAPAKSSLTDLIGNSPLSGGTIHRTRSENSLDTHSDLSEIYPMWPKRPPDSAESFQEDSGGDSSANTPYNIGMSSEGSQDIKLEWKLFREKMKQKQEGKEYSGEIAPAEENISNTSIQSTNISSSMETSFLSAYDENIKRHKTKEPTVLSASAPDQQESLEESIADLTDTLASGSFPAQTDASVQVDLPEKKHSSEQTDLSGDIDMPIKENVSEESISSSILPPAIQNPSQEASKEETPTFLQPHSIIHDESLQTALPDTRDKSDQAIPPATKDKSVQVNIPTKKETSVGMQTDFLKSETRADLPTTVGISEQADLFTKTTSDKDKDVEVEELKDGSKLDHPRSQTDISEEDAHSLFQALSGSAGVAKASPSDTERSETDEILTMKSTYQQTRPSSQGLRSRSGSMTPPRRSTTMEVEEPQKQTIGLPRTSSGQADALATSSGIGLPSIVTPSQYKEPVVVKPVQQETKITSKSLRQRSLSPTPTRSSESRDTSTGSQEQRTTPDVKTESPSIYEKEEDQPPSRDIDTTLPESSDPPPTDPSISYKPPSGENKHKEE